MVNIEQKKVNSEPNNVYFSFYPHFLGFMIAYWAHLQKPDLITCCYATKAIIRGKNTAVAQKSAAH